MLMRMKRNRPVYLDSEQITKAAAAEVTAELNIEEELRFLKQLRALPSGRDGDEKIRGSVRSVLTAFVAWYGENIRQNAANFPTKLKTVGALGSANPESQRVLKEFIKQNYNERNPREVFCARAKKRILDANPGLQLGEEVVQILVPEAFECALGIWSKCPEDQYRSEQAHAKSDVVTRHAVRGQQPTAATIFRGMMLRVLAVACRVMLGREGWGLKLKLEWKELNANFLIWTVNAKF